jgi:DnaJ-class molecular chaperone
VEVKEEIVVEIPAGAGFGSRIRIRGKGTDGLGTHADGDLHLELEPKDTPGFNRDGLDLHGSCLIPAAIARNGGSVVVELPRGRVKVKVPERTCMGDRFRLRGQGLPKGKTGILGDAYLTVKVEEK